MKKNVINIKNLIGGIALLAMISATASCEKFIAVDTPPNAIGSENAFQDSATATSVVLGIYSNLGTGSSNALFNSIKYNAMSADEGYYFSNTSFDNFKNNTLAAGNDANIMFGNLYTSIGRANYAIEGLAKAENLTPGLRSQLQGEARFLRAWLYFQLVNFFGKTPLVTNTQAIENSQLPRAEVADVYKQIITDLTEAKQLLLPAYPSAERARANRHAASALLAKVYLYQSNWAGAETEASAVISSGSYGLVMDLNQVFLKNSNETIWQLSLLGLAEQAAIQAIEFVPASAPTFVLYDTLVNTFENNDQRKVAWTKAITSQGVEYLHPYKYKTRQTTSGSEYPIVFRLAEMYLIRAEARANQNKTEDGVKDINEVRGRAQIGLLPLDTGKDALLAALEHERWVELFTEADRWWNLKRLGKATAVLSLIKPDWEPYQQLYPIPLQARTANPNLDDNPEY